MAQTFYSNISNIKLSAQEFVLEFGSVFPSTPPPPGTVLTFEPDVRVVMTLAGLKPYMEALQKALQALEHQQAMTSQPNPTPQAASK